LDVFTVSFFGHRILEEWKDREIEEVIKMLLIKYEYVEFLVGRSGDFDQLVSSTIRRVRREWGSNNSSHTLVLPYLTAEFKNNEEILSKYYSEIEFCEASINAHFKSAYQIRNREMVDRSNLIVCYLKNDFGGVYQTIKYAEKLGKRIINVAMK